MVRISSTKKGRPPVAPSCLVPSVAPILRNSRGGGGTPGRCSCCRTLRRQQARALNRVQSQSAHGRAAVQADAPVRGRDLFGQRWSLLDRSEFPEEANLQAAGLEDVPSQCITRLQLHGEPHFTVGLLDVSSNCRLAILAVVQRGAAIADTEDSPGILAGPKTYS